ncbi:cyanophycin synthetase, partial [uncultured Bifidobacterium sp.]
IVRVPVTLAVPGLHNARNATAAIIAATLLGMDPHAAADAASTFLGAARRFQIRAQVGGVTVVDDYAHHPTEIAALLDAARRRYPQATIHVLFQPHLFSRTKFFAKEFADALAKADDVIVTGVFPSRERQQDFPDVSAATIADAAGDDASIDVEERMETAAQMIAMRAKPGDVVFTVGAGDITKMAPVIAHVLEAHAGKDD